MAATAIRIVFQSLSIPSSLKLLKESLTEPLSQYNESEWQVVIPHDSHPYGTAITSIRINSTMLNLMAALKTVPAVIIFNSYINIILQDLH